MTEGANIIYPDSLLPSSLADGEAYASVRDILENDDLQQATIHVPYWRVNGRAAAIRVRALTLEERERVNSLTDAADQFCRIWQYGCMQPVFTQEQAQALRRKNPNAIDQVARFILTLSRLDQDWIARVVEEQTQAAPAVQDEQDEQPDASPTRRIKRVA